MTDPTPPPTDPDVLNLRRMALRTGAEVVQLRADVAAAQAKLEELAARVQASEAGGDRAGLDRAEDNG